VSGGDEQARAFGFRAGRKRMNADVGEAGFVEHGAHRGVAKAEVLVAHRVAVLVAVVLDHVDGQGGAAGTKHAMHLRQRDGRVFQMVQDQGAASRSSRRPRRWARAR